MQPLTFMYALKSAIEPEKPGPHFHLREHKILMYLVQHLRANTFILAGAAGGSAEQDQPAATNGLCHGT